MTVALSAVLDIHDMGAGWLCYGKKFTWLGQGTETTSYRLRKTSSSVFIEVFPVFM